MKRILSGALILMVGASVQAAELIKLSPNQTIPQSHSLFRSSNSASASLKLVKKYAKHSRYQQLIDGIPVYGHQVIYHSSGSKAYYSGAWVQHSPQETLALRTNTTTLDANTALTLAKSNFVNSKHNLKSPGYQYRNQHSTLYYYLDKTKQLKKVFLVNFVAEGEQGTSPARPYYLIDANSKAIIRQWDGLTTNRIGTGPGGNEKVGRYEYGVDYPKLDVTMETDGISCDMANQNVETIDLHHSDDGEEIYAYTCPYHSDDDHINGGYSPLNDAHYFGGIIVSMYQDWYQTQPLSFKLKMRVHYGIDFENAFWDGSTMNFGDGAEAFYPLVALDVAAHEVSHGVTEQNSALEYWGQSGGINEAFSDMAGKTAEYYARGQNTWSVGIDITKSTQPLRYMDRPERDGNSIGDARDFEPGLDVHFTSGVYNRFFYKLATSEGWDTKKAFAVMLAANQHYWQAESDYYDAAEGILQATQDLAYDVDAVIAAAKAVGISCEKSMNAFQCTMSVED